MLKTYADFVARVEECGFYAFYGKFLDGFPMLQHETVEKQWHTGDPETDPWLWKDRVAQERQLAFGCVLGGYKGFISKRLYPLFYVANHPVKLMEERFEAGEISQITWQLWQLFEEQGQLSTAEIRTALGVTKKNGASRVDNTIKELQKQFYITVSGNQRKVSLDGREYGWPANTYSRVEDWASLEWLAGIEKIDPAAAREQILDIGVSTGSSIDRVALAKVLFRKSK